MTNLTIFIPCLEGQRNTQELDINAWRNTSPAPGDAISLGQHPRWIVAEVVEFKSCQVSFPVYLAFIAVDEVPDRTQWISYIAQKRFPDQAITVAYSQVNEPIIQTGTVYQTPLESEKIAFLGYRTEAIQQWEMGLVHEMSPTSQGSLYRAIYLCQCEAKPTLISA